MKEDWAKKKYYYGLPYWILFQFYFLYKKKFYFIAKKLLESTNKSLLCQTKYWKPKKKKNRWTTTIEQMNERNTQKKTAQEIYFSKQNKNETKAYFKHRISQISIDLLMMMMDNLIAKSWKIFWNKFQISSPTSLFFQSFFYDFWKFFFLPLPILLLLLSKCPDNLEKCPFWFWNCNEFCMCVNFILFQTKNISHFPECDESLIHNLISLHTKWILVSHTHNLFFQKNYFSKNNFFSIQRKFQLTKL